MTEKPIPAQIKAAITRFSAAAQDHAFRRAAGPVARTEIETEYARARELLERVIAKYIGQP